MSFLNPWVAAALAAIVIPALVILYFLKLRRRQEVVPSTFLWKRAVQDLQVNAPFQRLRKNLLLFLQLLILAAALFALARPIIQTDVAGESSVIIMLDRSASMNAKEGERTRFELAKEQAIRLVKTLNRTGGGWLDSLGFAGASAKTRVMVIAFADRAKVIAPFTTNTTDVIGLIEELEPTDAQTNLRDALDLAQAYLMPARGNVETGDATGAAGGPVIANPIAPESASKLILLSDGCVPDVREVAVLGGHLTLIPIGEQRDNVGITSMRLARNYEKPELLSVFVKVENFGPETITTDVTLYVDGQFSSSRVETVTLGPPRRGTAQATAAPADESPNVAQLNFEFPLDRGAVLEARLSRNDHLATDNRAYAVVPPPRRLTLLVVGDGNFFLEKVADNLPLEKAEFLTLAQYQSAGPGVVEVEGRSVYDIVVFDKCAPPRLPAGNYLFLGAVPPQTEITAEGEVENFALLWWDDAHPLLRYVALDYVWVAAGSKLQVPKAAQKLIEGPDGPVLVRYTKDGRNYLVLSFPPEKSTWPLKMSFPVFLYNAVRYFGDADLLSDQAPTRPGDPLLVQVPADAPKTTIERPDGRKDIVLPDPQQIARYAATHRVGVYRAEPGIPGRDRFAVNLVDSAESDIAPRTDFQIGGITPQIGEAIKTATPEIWRWFVGAALVVALLEWYIYNRRVMI